MFQSIQVLQSKWCFDSSLDIYSSSCKYILSFFFLLSVNHEFFCVQMYLIVVDRLQCSEWHNSSGAGTPGEAADVGLSPFCLPSATQGNSLSLFSGGLLFCGSSRTPSVSPVFADLQRYSRGMDCFCWTFLSQNKKPDFLLQNSFLPFFPCWVPLYCAYCGLLHSALYYDVHIFIWMYFFNRCFSYILYIQNPVWPAWPLCLLQRDSFVFIMCAFISES